MFASRDAESAHHQDRVSELGGELNGPSCYAYIFSWRTSLVRAASTPILWMDLSQASDKFHSNCFKNFFAHSKAAGYGTSLISNNLYENILHLPACPRLQYLAQLYL